MRLVSCHIDGFGKIRNTDYSFNSGFNGICENNGWGKSTLLTFIRVMLYGFENENKKNNVLESERLKYKPWEGDLYGGNLTIEANGHTYTIYKSFGKKSSEDVIETRATDTNLLVNGINGQNILGIDGAGFMRTLFIAQNDCNFTDTNGKKDSGISTTVGAKISSLVDNTEDASNFDTVMLKLDDKIKSICSAKKAGAVDRINSEITDIECRLRDKDRLETALDELEDKKNAEEEKLSELKDRRSLLSEKMSASATVLQDKARKEKYEKLIKDEYERQDVLSEIKIKFPNGIPDKEKMEHMNDILQSFTEGMGRLKDVTFSDEDNTRYNGLYAIYGENYPTIDEIEEIRTDIKSIYQEEKNIAENDMSPSDKKRFEELCTFFENGEPDIMEIDELTERLGEATDKKRDLDQLLVQKEILEQQHNEKKAYYLKQKKQFKVMLLITGIVFLVAGLLVFAFTKNLIFAAPVWLTAVVFMIISFLKTKPYPENQKLNEIDDKIYEITDFINNVDDSLRLFTETYPWDYVESQVLYSLFDMKRELGVYHSLLDMEEKSNCRHSRELIDELWDKVKNFIGTYKEFLNMDTPSEALNILNLLEKEVSEYVRLSDQYKKQLKLAEDCKNYKSELQDFIMANGLGRVEYQSFQTALKEVEENILNYSSALKECERAENEKNIFEKENPDCEELLHLEFDDTEEMPVNLSDSINELDEEIRKIQDVCAGYESQTEQIDSKLQELYELEMKLDQLKEERESGLHTYDILVKTREYMRQAKTEMTNRFTVPVMNEFVHYYKEITGFDGNEFMADSNLSVTIMSSGLQRDIRLLSMGQQDLIGICMRLALVKSMYRQELPFIVLDDPFTNLDSDSVKKAVNLIKSMGEDYQILYFTCHNSRMPV